MTRLLKKQPCLYQTLYILKNTIIVITLFAGISLQSCSPQKIGRTTVQTTDTTAIAFPGAEGFGKWTTGGRGGDVYVVTNLNDNGEGSLRKGVVSNGPKIIVFAVSGTIHLESPLDIKPNTTIAGQTAPGDGICLADQPVKLAGDNIIIRYMRFRMGDRHQRREKVHGSGHDDALSATKRNRVIIDHCSISWSTDEVFTVYAGDSTTLQWNIIAEPLNYSYHFETGDTDFENHGYGGIWGGKHLSAHHNLFAHCISRTPRFAGTRYTKEETVDFRNNVIYNWSHNNVYGGEGGQYNLVNNYYKWGPATRPNVKYRVANPSKQEAPQIPYGKYYIVGNYVDGSEEVTANNWAGVTMGNGGTAADKESAKLANAVNTESITTHTALVAFQLVLQKAGASLQRDTLDQRIANDVENRTGRIIDVQGGFPHGTPYEQTVTAWPLLRSKPAPTDKDQDGMPDEWERKNGLNPASATDAVMTTLHSFYTNIEVYINSLVPAQNGLL